MAYGILVLCTVVLYAPHIVLCGMGIRWQPMLFVVSLLSSLIAFLPLVVTGAVFQVLHCLGVADAAVATSAVMIHFILQNAVRVGVLHACLCLQRLGWEHGCLLVRSRFPLVPLSIAVGAGFAATSVLVSGGALLAEAWAVAGSLAGSKSISSSSRSESARGADVFAHSEGCAGLPRFVLACFQQTFFTCGQVAWTVMVGQAYAALWPQDAGKDSISKSAASSTSLQGVLLFAEASAEGAGGDTVSMPQVARLDVEDVRLVVTEQLLVDADLQQPAFGGSRPDTMACSETKACSCSAAVSMSREDAEAKKGVARSGARFASDDAGADTGSASTPSRVQIERSTTASESAEIVSPPSSLSDIAGWIVGDSVFAQRLPTAAITGAAALALHGSFVLLPLTAMNTNTDPAHKTATSSEGSEMGVCFASVLLQCVVTIVSVVWGLWIVQFERYPSAYMLLPLSASGDVPRGS